MSETVRLLGLGLEPRDHATVEVLQALAECDEVRAQGFGRQDLEFLKRQCRRGALKSVAQDAPPKPLARALVAAARRGRRVSLATPIHPFYYGPAGAAVVAECAAKKVLWKSFGSISPMGAAISKAGVTLGTNVFGLQSFEAEALADKAVEPNPVWPLILYFVRAPDAAARSRLGRALARFYPKSHPALWCAGARVGEKTDLADALRTCSSARTGDTLYLPEAKATASTLGRPDRHHVVIKGAVAPPLVEGE